VIEPIDPLERGELDGLEVTPRSFGSDHFGLEEADDGFSERIIVRVATAAHRRLDPGIGQTFRMPHLLAVASDSLEGDRVAGATGAMRRGKHGKCGTRGNRIPVCF